MIFVKIRPMGVLCATASCWCELGAAAGFWVAALLCAGVLLLRRWGGAEPRRDPDGRVTFLTKLQLALVVASDLAVAVRFSLVAALQGDSMLAALVVVGSFALALPWVVAQALQRQQRAGREHGLVVASLCLAAVALLGCAGGFAYSGWLLRQIEAVAFATNMVAAALLASLSVTIAVAAFIGQERPSRNVYERLSLREVAVLPAAAGHEESEPAKSLSAIEAQLEDEKEGDEELDGGEQEEQDKKDEEEEAAGGEGAARRFLLRSIGHEGELLAAAVVIAVAMVAGQLGQSFLWGSIVALVSAPAPGSDARGQLLAQCLALLYVVLAYSMLLGLQSVLVKVASLRVAASARIQLFTSVLGRSLQFHNTCKPGELMSRLSNDADAISESTSHAVVVIRGT
jgi:hypothetical protein